MPQPILPGSGPQRDPVTPKHAGPTADQPNPPAAPNRAAAAAEYSDETLAASPIAAAVAKQKAAIEAAEQARLADGEAASVRLGSLDCFRGLVLFLLCVEAANYGWQHAIARAHPGDAFWQAVEFHASHVAWVGCAMWDLIQPAFSFMVGVAMAYSYTKRQRLGQSYGRMLLHAAWRAAVLVLLGVFLRSMDSAQTYWTFEDTLTQIGLGYFFLFLLWNRPAAVQGAAAAVLLIGYGALFYFWPVKELDPALAAGDHWEQSMAFDGHLAHWNKNANVAHDFDLWFMNLFPREEPFVANDGGYSTLSFVPTLATMIFGLMAGALMRSERRPAPKFWLLLFWGVALGAAGWALDHFGIVPMVKRIWTPSFGLYSGGWCLVILAFLYAIIDLARLKFLAAPFAVLGANSILIYVATWTFAGWANEQIKIHFGASYANWFGTPFQPLMENLCVAALIWLIALWLYRRRIFVRI